MRFGEKLSKLRKSNGLTQENLAEKLGVSRQAVSRWEADETSPDITMLSAICGIFGVSADYMINDNDSGGEIPSGTVADYMIHDSYEDTVPEPADKKKMLRHLFIAVLSVFSGCCFVIAAALLTNDWLLFRLEIICIAASAFSCVFNFIKFLQAYSKSKNR